MKKITILLIVILLAGCVSTEEEISDYTEEKIKNDYGIAVKTKSVEEQKGYGSLLVMVFDKLFYNRYHLIFEVEDDPNFTFEGYLVENNRGDIESFQEDFILDRHTYLLKHSREYQEKNQMLVNNGLTDIHIVGDSVKGEAIVEFYVYYNGKNANTEEVVNTLYEIASFIVKVPFEISLSMTVEPKYRPHSEDISIKGYSENERKELENLLAEQLEFGRKYKFINEEIDRKLEEELNLSILSFLDVGRGSASQEKVFTKQTISLGIYQEYNETNLLKAFDILRAEGLDEISVRLSLPDKQTDYNCKVKEVRNISDFNRCYKKNAGSEHTD
ncbi:hypothetical protein [Metabacillus fastidiosus]|uniref:hypothetical protein n=1 Tax=Metabacillus fastidiosus TaxID=1458 RepID=UPI002E1FF51E|nr:hypothetical protein [Metabacillus fastidiosus]